MKFITKVLGWGSEQRSKREKMMLSYAEATTTVGLAHRPALTAEWLQVLPPPSAGALLWSLLTP